MRSFAKALLVLAMLLSVALTYGDSFTISTSFNQLQPGVDNQGWLCNAFANNNPTNDNYFTGYNQGNEYRSFFSFDLSGVSGTVISATFMVCRYGEPVPVTLGLFDVSTPAATLISTRPNVMSPTIFADLGSGTSYGSFSLTPGPVTDILSFSLNANALANINTVTGSGYFSIGAAALGGSGWIFAGSNEEPGASGGRQNSIQQLVLTTVPEPSTLGVAGIGAAALFFFSRRR